MGGRLNGHPGVLTLQKSKYQRVVDTRLCDARPITSMTCLTRDVNDTRIAVSQGDGCISLLRVGENAELTSIFSIQVQGVGPIAVSFANEKAQSIYVMGQEDTTWYARDA